MKNDNKEKYECFYNFMHSQLIKETATVAEALKTFEEIYEFNNSLIGDAFKDSSNTSITLNSFPNYVTSSTDDYGKSTIHHFKSWNEESERDDCLINDYEGGIKHFQD